MMVALSACGMLIVVVLFPATDTFKEGFDVGKRVGAIGSLVVCTALAFVVARDKKILGQFRSILLILGTAVLAGIGGGLLGMIIPAYLSTRDVYGEGSVASEQSAPQQEASLE